MFVLKDMWFVCTSARLNIKYFTCSTHLRQVLITNGLSKLVYI